MDRIEFLPSVWASSLSAYQDYHVIEKGNHIRGNGRHIVTH